MVASVVNVNIAPIVTLETALRCDRCYQGQYQMYDLFLFLVI